MRGRWASASYRSRHSQTSRWRSDGPTSPSITSSTTAAQRQIEAQQRQIEALQQQKQQPQPTNHSRKISLKSCKNMLTYTKKDYYLTRNFRNSRRTCYQRFNLEAAPRWLLIPRLKFCNIHKA